MKLTTKEVWEHGQLKDIEHTMAFSADIVQAHNCGAGRILVEIVDADCNDMTVGMSIEQATSLRDQLTAAIQEATK